MISSGRSNAARYGMKPSLHDALYPWLELREQQLWAGRPEPIRMARARIGIALAGLAVIFLVLLTPLRQYFLPFSPNIAEALPYSQSEIRFIEAIPFSMLLIGIFLIAQPFTSYYYAGRTMYAVTGKRLLMVRKDMFGILVKTARYDAIEAPILNLHSGGTGDIFFFQKSNIPEIGLGPSPLTRFLGVREAEHIHQLISNRLTGSVNGQVMAEPVQDYLEILVRVGRRLDEKHDR
jgi:hypothetical protein